MLRWKPGANEYEVVRLKYGGNGEASEGRMYRDCIEPPMRAIDSGGRFACSGDEVALNRHRRLAKPLLN